MVQTTHRFLETRSPAQVPIPRSLHRSTPLQSKHGCWGAHVTGCSSRLQLCTCCSTSRSRPPSATMSRPMRTSRGWARSSRRRTSALVRLLLRCLRGHASHHDICLYGTVFWGGFCLGRGLSVIISTKLSPRTMCFFGVISATLVMAALVAFKEVCQHVEDCCFLKQRV